MFINPVTVYQSRFWDFAGRRFWDFCGTWQKIVSTIIAASNISIRPPQNAPNFKLCKELVFLSLELVTFQRFLDSCSIK